MVIRVTGQKETTDTYSGIVTIRSIYWYHCY